MRALAKRSDTISEFVSTVLMDREATTHLIHPNIPTQK